MFTYTEDIGYLIGLIAGDGSIVDKTVYLANVDKDVIEEYRRICSGFTHNPMRTYENPHEFKGHQCYSESHRFYAPELSAFLLASVGKGAFNKVVPLPNGDLEFTRGVLSGVWDSDGSVTINRTRSNIQGQVSLTSRSRLLIASVDEHLKFIGCRTSVYEYSKEDKPLYILNVLTSSIATFASNTKLRCSERSNRLTEILTFTVNTRFSSKFKIDVSLEDINRFLNMIKVAEEVGCIDNRERKNLYTILRRNKHGLKLSLTENTYERLESIRIKLEPA